MTMLPGITKNADGIENLSWNVLGQTYVPKQRSESSFSWHATFPAGAFVPPHVHPMQDEFVYVLEGQLDFWLDGKEHKATPGDLARLSMGIPHGIFNKSGQTVKCFFWVSPTRKLFELFSAINNVADPAEVVRIAAKHEIDFLPPPNN